MKKYDRLSDLKVAINKYINELYKTLYMAISRGIENEYMDSYRYMAYSLEMISQAIINYDKLTEDVIKASVDNPINGLTLTDTLEKNRQNIIYDIDRTITKGIYDGLTYGSMARAIKKVLGGDYEKAIRVVRTETHRVNEQGKHESAMVAHEQGIKQVKKWVSMRDERVRDMHQEMDGVEIPLDQDFKTPDGVTGPCPGSMGSAKHDIHCRCISKRRIVDIEEKVADDSIFFNETYSEWIKNKKI